MAQVTAGKMGKRLGIRGFVVGYFELVTGN
jgi:hypothetical protein